MERETKIEEKKESEKWKKRKNIIWRKIEGRSEKKREEKLKRMVEKVLGKEEKIIRVRDKRGEEKGRVLIAEFEKERVVREIMENRGEIKYYWEMKLDKDLTMRERRNRWRMVEKARNEREKDRRVRITNKRIWIERVEWRWVEKRKEWGRVDE